MISIGDLVPKDLRVVPMAPVTLADSVAKDVLADSTNSNIFPDIAGILLFNGGSNNAYYAFGADCSLTYYNGYIQPGGSMTIPVRQRVSMFSVGGTIIAITMYRRCTYPEVS